MSERLETLLDELARRHASGEELDVAGLLADAGDEADAFAQLADRLLQATPRREATPATLAYVAALAEPPLLRLRVRRKLRFGAVVKQLAAALQVQDVTRLEGYYHRLEGGLLDPEPVDGTVWAVLEKLLQAPARALALASPGGPGPESAVFYRAELAQATFDALPPDQAAGPRTTDPSPAERDELDRLFLGTR